MAEFRSVDLASGIKRAIYENTTTALVKSIITNVFIILAAAAGVILLLKNGGDAGTRKVKQITAPVASRVADAVPIRPQTIQGQIDNFHQPVALERIRSWGPDIKYSFMLTVSANPKLNQPSVRVVLTYQTAAPIVLEIQYTVPQNMFDMIQANPATKNKFDGVAVQVTTEGAGYNTSALLKLDPQRRADDRKWLSYNLILPPATKEIHFWIAGIPPRYDVSGANCAISLPQLRVTPAKVPAASGAEPSSTTKNP